MNLNDFVVLPYNKAKSIKLNARNLQALQMETVTLAQESEGMEEKLQQLKESMSREKEERGHSGGFRWKSGQCVSLNSSALKNSTKKNKENTLQKLSAGKVKIRVLKDEPLTAPPQPPPPPPLFGLRTTRKSRLRGSSCGQCEVRTAGLMCAECTEDYCIGCFAKFHQKGALKLHRMIPIQTDLQTHVSTQDVVSCFQTQINPDYHPGHFPSLNPSPNCKPSPNHNIKSNAITRQEDDSPVKGIEAVAKPVVLQLHPDPSQMLSVNHGEEERGFPTTLLGGEYNVEESVRSFQEALRQWRGEKSDGGGGPMSENAMWRPVQPVSVSDTATQADLAADRGADGRGRRTGDGTVPVRVEFTKNSLTYMERLLLKKHHRKPIEVYHPTLALNLLPNTNTEEVTASSLTAQEEDFRRYCASLFEPQITAPESCLTIEVLDETGRDIDGDFAAEEKTANVTRAPSVQKVLSKGQTVVPHTALKDGGSSSVSCSSPKPPLSSRQSRAPAQAAQKSNLSKPQTLQGEYSMKSSSSKSKPSGCPTDETPRTSRTSIKTPTSMSKKSNRSPAGHKSKPDHVSPRLLSSPSLPFSQTEIPKSSHTPDLFPPHFLISPLTSATPPIPEDRPSPSPSTSFSLRSTFTLSPLGSTESTLLPKVYQSPPFQKGSDLSLLPEQPQSSPLFQGPISSFYPSQSPPSNLESSRQSQHSLCDPESLLSDNQLQLPLSSVSSSPIPPPKSLEQSPRLKTQSGLSLINKSLPDEYFGHRSSPKNEDAPVFMSSTPTSGDHGSTLSLQDAQFISSLPSHLFSVIQNPPLTVKTLEEEELSLNSGDEMSSDSLALGPHEEDSSDEEAQRHGRLTRVRSREEEQGNPAGAHLQDSFVSEERDIGFSQTDEQLSMVMHRQSAGSGSEQSCDLDEFPPLGLDLNFGHSIKPEHTHCDTWHTSQTSRDESNPTGSEGYWPSSSLNTEEHLVFRMMKDNCTQPTGVPIHSTTPTKREEKSANERVTSGCDRSSKLTPNLSRAPTACCLSCPTLDSELTPVLRPLSRAAQEIMEICSVDQTGCEDPDLDADTTAHTLQELEQELRHMTQETGKQTSVFAAGTIRSNPHIARRSQSIMAATVLS